jgi:hypothetical protein
MIVELCNLFRAYAFKTGPYAVQQSSSEESSEPSEIISYANRHYGEGRIYCERNSEPDLTGFRAVFGDDNE